MYSGNYTIASQQFKRIFEKLQNDVQFSSVLIHGEKSVPPSFFEHEFVNHFNPAIIRLSTGTHFPLIGSFKKDILALVYLDKLSYQQVLESLAEAFYLLAQSKFILLFNENEIFLDELMRLCWKLKFINVVVLMDNFITNLTYYNFNPFPELTLETHTLQENGNLFPDRMINLKGHAISILVSSMAPRDFIYTNRRGESVLAGYCGHLVAAFADLYNATLFEPFANDSNTKYTVIPDQIFDIPEGSIDIFLNLQPIMPPFKSQSDFYEICACNIMLPAEPRIPTHLYYPMLLTSPTVLFMFGMIIIFSLVLNLVIRIETNIKSHLFDIILHEKSLRAVIGQSFAEYRRSSVKLRIVYICSLVCGIFLSLVFATELGTLLTKPPRQRQIRTWEDIRKSEIKVIEFRKEYDLFIKFVPDLAQYRDVFEHTETYLEFYTIRQSLDRRYGYPVTSTIWAMFKEQQRYFSEPQFRFSDTVGYLDFMPMGFILPNNSIYKEKLNRAIARVQETGLVQHWMKYAFWEAVEAGKMKMTDFGTKWLIKPLAMDHLTWVWGLFAVLTTVNCTVFILEMCWFKLSKGISSIKQIHF